MKSAILFGFLAIAASVSCQRRDPPSSGSSDDTLQVFGSPSGGGSGGSDSSSGGISSTNRKPGGRRGSDSQSNRGTFTNGGSVGSSSSSDDSNPGVSGSDASTDTGFNRLTTQSSDRGRISGSSGDRADAGSIVAFSGRKTRQPPTLVTRPTTPAWDSDDTFTRHGSGDNSDSGVSSGRLTRFPDNVRVEVEIERLDNPKGIIATGKSCDYLSKCDTKLYAIIDTESPQAAFPGVIPTARFPVMFSANNNDSPTITKVVKRDLCGTTITQAALRVRVVDTDSISAEDEITKFTCIFPVTPVTIARDQVSASFGADIPCTASAQGDKIKLFVRQRAYQISSSNCNSQTLDQQ